MKRSLIFDDSPRSASIYRALHLAIRFGRNAVQHAPGKTVLRQERDVRRLLETLGVADGATDPLARVLCPAGGTLAVPQGLIELLQTRIDQGAWTGDMAVDMADALDFLSAAPDVKEAADG